VVFFPIRCFTCGALIEHKYDEYQEKVRAGAEPGKVLDSLGFKRYCCRRMFLSHVDVADDVLKYGRL